MIAVHAMRKIQAMLTRAGNEKTRLHAQELQTKQQMVEHLKRRDSMGIWYVQKHLFNIIGSRVCIKDSTSTTILSSDWIK
jgi:hypothetical protein